MEAFWGRGTQRSIHELTQTHAHRNINSFRLPAVSYPLAPQLLVRTDFNQYHQLLVDNGFWKPAMSVSRSTSPLQDGYYRPLVGQNHWIIGRHRKCDILIPDRCVSQHHALLFTANKDDFYFSDLGSLNGSFVNGTRHSEPVHLQHGDCLQIGEIELEFQHPSSVPVSETDQRVVLMIQPANLQGKIWQALLMAQGVVVQWETNRLETTDAFEHLLREIKVEPDLLLIDIDKISPNPYEFCRWCRAHHALLKIILTCGNRTEVVPAECSWARQQGALHLLSGFDEDHLLSDVVGIVNKVNRVLRAIHKEPIEHPAMVSMLIEMSDLTVLH